MIRLSRREFRLPAAIPFIFAGMKIAATMTMIGLVNSSRCVIGLTMYGVVLALEKIVTQRFRIDA